MIDDFTIRRIKDAASIVDVVGEFYSLRKSGTEYECLCPFHQDRHMGSFKVSPRKNIYTCFSCGETGGPVDFLMKHENLTFPDAIRWLGKKYGIEVEGSEQFTVKPSAPHTPPPPLPLLQLPPAMVKRTRDISNDNLCNWLRSIKWDGAQRARIDKVLKAYMVGHSKDGLTVFWNIDEGGIIRTGKMMKYKPDGHRDKDSIGNFGWIHSRLFKAGKFDGEQWDVKKTLYGMHLLNLAKHATINIVESEKTALFMSICYGGMARNLWMASGGKSNLSREKLKPLIEQRRDIFLYPDHDGIEEWKEQAKLINYPNLYVKTDIDKEYWRPEDGEKADIADILFRIIQGNERVESTKVVGDVLEEMAKENTALQQLIDTFELEKI